MRKEQRLPDEVSPETTAMFKVVRGVVRMIMYYMKPTPPEGDLPNLIAKVGPRSGAQGARCRGSGETGRGLGLKL